MLEPAEAFRVLSAALATDCAMALRLTPGRYRVSVGYEDEQEGWAALWCRLTRS